MKTLPRFLAALALLAAPLSAAITVSVDMDPATPGIQNTRVVAAGQVITVDLVLAVGAEGVSSYGVSAQFDNAELALNGSPATTVPALPGGLAFLSTPLENNALGRVYSVNGATLGNGPVSTSFVIASISFTAAAPVTDASADVSLGFFNTGVDGCYDNAGNAVVPTFVSGKVDLSLVVTSNADSGVGSLRSVLTAAATQGGADTITFAPELTGQSITLTSEIVVNDAPGVTLDTSSVPGGVTIDGGIGTNRILTVASGTTLNIAGLTFTGGGGAGTAETGYGGAIENQGTLTITRCTFAGNSAATGGGAIDNFNGTLTLTNCTVSGNSTPGNGGAIYNFGTLTLTHSTLSGNSTGNSGGGIFLSGHSLHLANTIVAGNGADILNSGGAITLTGGNLIGNNATTNIAAGPLVGTPGAPLDARLAPLASYGGPTQTMALLPGSPARNAAVGSTATADQRGFPIVGTPDLGAYEAGTFTNYNAFIWESLPATATVAQHAITFDYDGDGANNLSEWLALTNPGDPASYLRITQVTRTAPNVQLTFPSAVGRTYTFEHTNTLAPGFVWAVTGGSVAGTGSPITATIGPFPGATQLFLRIRVGP